ncbi:MAG: dihydropteroate synthase [Candidatus Thermoplasmatota archaeon]|nr:dihydropteroate synthase [Candidatus Thermoplasmatota archaeon]MEC7254610.1 dihydropteroate synthase [Candidatus Thermoplasmatota archaeon]
MADALVPFSFRHQSPIPKIMGILNVTPDSFHASSRQENGNEAISNGLSMIDEGATILDIGGESTRPGSDEVSIEEEIERVLPVITGLREASKTVPLSIDTRNHEVARKALDAGATIINDVSGLRDEKMVELVLDRKVPVCIMHMLGEPKTMQKSPSYRDVVREVSSELLTTAQQLVDAGHSPDHICLDPGIGFGKTLQHNIDLLRGWESFRGEYEFPILWGVSRKSMIGQLTGHSSTDDRLYGTLGVAAFAQKVGIDWLRVHDVQAHTDLLQVMNKLG